jgi:hypothetical protein
MFGEEERVWCLPFTSSRSFHGTGGNQGWTHETCPMSGGVGGCKGYAMFVNRRIRPDDLAGRWSLDW